MEKDKYTYTSKASHRELTLNATILNIFPAQYYSYYFGLVTVDHVLEVAHVVIVVAVDSPHRSPLLI